MLIRSADQRRGAFSLATTNLNAEQSRPESVEEPEIADARASGRFSAASSPENMHLKPSASAAATSQCSPSIRSASAAAKSQVKEMDFRSERRWSAPATPAAKTYAALEGGSTQREKNNQAK